MPVRIEGPTSPAPIDPWNRRRAEEKVKAAQTRRKRNGAITLGVVVLVVASAIWNPPTGSNHDFTKASNYKPVSESGCTNSGKGCHGSETSYNDFNAYHKDVACTRCHDYQGVGCIPCHKPSAHECALCHDGTMQNAADVVRLTDPYPKGHYRETTHTAMGTDVTAQTQTTESGEASATCGDCHSRDLKKSHTDVEPVEGSPYGTAVGCSECHNDARSLGLAQVLSDWKERRCEDCHTEGSSSPMHSAKIAGKVEATAAAGCAWTGKGCHDGNDVHAMHPDVPARCAGSSANGEPGCHKLGEEAPKPKSYGCGISAGGCHQTYEPKALSHKKDGQVHSPTDETAASATYRGIRCGACHDMRHDGVSLNAEHTLWTSAKTLYPDDGCRNCHNDPASRNAIADKWPGRDTAYACDDCHGTEGLPREHDPDLTAAHGSDSAGCASTGGGCHPTADLSEVGAPTVSSNIHRDCLRCHDRTAAGGNQSYDPRRKSCGAGRSCHQYGDEYDPASSVHNGVAGPADGADTAHHTASGARGRARLVDAASGVSTPCGSCHDMRVGTEHSRPNSRIAVGKANVCIRCHNATGGTSAVVKSGWAARTSSRACAACHGTKSVPAPHGRIGNVHTHTELATNGQISPGACVRAGCHTTTDVRILHREAGCALAGCHSSKGNINGRGVRSCGGVDPRTSCHTGYSATTGHGGVIAGHEAVELDPAGFAKPGSCAKAGCHTSLDLARLHRKSGCGVEGCHESAATPFMTGCGGPEPDLGCHSGFTAIQHFVDHTGELTGTVNGITYGVGENRGCFGCHMKDLRSEHSTAAAGPSIAGGGASPCRVCHWDPDDPGNGAYSGLTAVKDAIAGQDHRCLSCHASGSADPGPSAAASPHRHLSTATVLPAGRVWADPNDEWRAAFESPTGGGHNVLSAGYVGASSSRSFPVSTWVRGGTTFTWTLPPNSGQTTWLRSVFGTDVSTPGAIREVRVTCEDCHTFPDALAGPHGSSVKVRVDPNYSQTEYANPTRGTTSQFETSGTDRVVCFKCHNLVAGSVPGTSGPGGNPVHARHAEHPGFPSYNPVRWGEKCVDCHVRIPHAWRHQRLLIRTVETTDGVEGDAFPYVSRGHDGLVGMKLGDLDGASDLPPASCVTGGCHGRHDAGTHPSPGDIPGAAYWP